MNIITKGIVHPNEEGIQILLISSLKEGHYQELMELFDIDKILELCKNEGEKDRIKDFPISINKIGADRVICLGTEQAQGYELINRMQNRLYIITHRTSFTLQLKQFFINCTCIITEYNDIGSIDDAKELETMISDFVKSTS